MMRRRRGDARTSYARRARDMDRMGWCRTRPCCVPGEQPDLWFGPEPDACRRHVEAHHAGGYADGKAASHKAADNTVIPLCDHHHDALTDRDGIFAGWPPLALRAWQDAQIAKYQRLYEAHQRGLAAGLF